MPARPGPLRKPAAPCRSPLIASPPTSIARPEARPDAAELFFSSSGRLARAPYLAGVGAVLGALWLYGRWVEGVARDVTAWVVLPVLVFSGCCLTARRLHDMGRAGWWSAYPLALLVVAWPRAQGDYRVICAAMLGVLGVWLCAMPGQRRPNRFGAALRPPPLDRVGRAAHPAPMIPRYSRPVAADIWSPQTRYRIWFEIEAHAATAMAELGTIPKSAAEAIWAKGRDARFDSDRIDEIERTTKHDVIAFLTHVAEIVGEEARFLHQGMTSSDVLDTCLAVQLARSADLLIEDVDLVLAALKRRAIEHKFTPTLGRSHGIHAEPTTFGLKLAGHYAEFVRARKRLVEARAEIATCAISGAVGTFANVDPRVEQYVADRMGLTVEPVSTQVIPRDRHAAFFCALAVVASSVERLAVEIRHLQRTEVLEAEEPFDPGQKGSSAMPHKRNPILTENLTGLARLVRSAVTPALEDVALWHERDISHSSVERGIGPDATVHLDFALRRLASVMERLVIYPENMAKNLDRLGGLVHSQRVLLALTQKGLSREAAYAAVQRNAMKVWRGEGRFLDLLNADLEVSAALSPNELGALFDNAYHLKHVDTVFARVFGA